MGSRSGTFTIASSRFYKGDGGQKLEEASLFYVKSWGDLAERCHSLGHKGRGVRVIGRLKQYRWNGSDGKFHSEVFIAAERVEFRPERAEKKDS
jgi:single-strand DNA-binding protein